MSIEKPEGGQEKILVISEHLFNRCEELARRIYNSGVPEHQGLIATVDFGKQDIDKGLAEDYGIDESDVLFVISLNSSNITQEFIFLTGNRMLSGFTDADADPVPGEEAFRTKQDVSEKFLEGMVSSLEDWPEEEPFSLEGEQLKSDIKEVQNMGDVDEDEIRRRIKRISEEVDKKEKEEE